MSVKNKIKIGNKLFIILPLLFSFIFFNSVFVSAIGSDNVTLLISEIRNDNFLNKAMVVNISVSIIANENYTHAYLYIQSASLTGNTTLVKINATNGVKNITSGAGGAGVAYNISITINSSLLEDGNDYTLTANLWNGTNYFNKTATVTIDNSIPSASTSLLPTSDTESTSINSVNFSSTVAGKNTTNCYINFTDTNPGNPSYAMVHGGDSCSLVLTSVPSLIYTWYVTASDGSNVTTSSNQQTLVETSSGSNGAAIYVKETGGKDLFGKPILNFFEGSSESSNKGWTPVIIIFVILLLTYFITRKK